MDENGVQRWGVLKEKWRFYQPLFWCEVSNYLVECLVFIHIYILAAWLTIREGLFDSGEMIQEIKLELFSSRLWTQKSTKPRRILIVGADGTIGSEIVQMILENSDFECHVVVHHANSTEHSWESDSRMTVYELDLVDKSQILLVADRLKSLHFDVAIFAAGTMLHPEHRTPDGVEMHNAVNVIGQLMLYELLQHECQRAVFLSSACSKMAVFSMDQDFLGVYAGPYQAYSSSKLNLAVYVKEMAQRRHVSCVSLHPGTVPGRLYRHANPLVRLLNATWLPRILRRPEMAAALVLHTVFRDDLEIGEYYEDTKVVPVTEWVPQEHRNHIYETIRRRIEIWMEA